MKVLSCFFWIKPALVDTPTILFTGADTKGLCTHMCFWKDTEESLLRLNAGWLKNDHHMIRKQHSL